MAVTKLDLRMLFMNSRLRNNPYTYIRRRTPVGEEVQVISRKYLDAWEYEYEQHFWEVNGKLVDIRDNNIEILAVTSGSHLSLTLSPIQV